MSTVDMVARQRPRWAFAAEPWVLVGHAAAMGALALLYPSSGDDWAWTTRGSYRMSHFFENLNGRWLGNLTVVGLTQMSALYPLVLALTLTAILFLLVHLAHLRTPLGYAWAAALLVLMPLGIWSETVVWISGFANYVTASLSLLVLVALVQREGEHTDRSSPVWRHPAVMAGVGGLVALAGTLFVEHVTVLVVLGSVVNLAAVVALGRRWHLSAAIAVGALAGAAIMFSHPAYRHLKTAEGGYQQVPDRGPLDLLQNAATGVSRQSVAMNLGLNLTLVVALALLLWGTLRRGTDRPGGPSTQMSRGTRVSRGAWLAVAAGVVGVAVGAWLWRFPLKSTAPELGWSWLASTGIAVAMVLGAATLVGNRSRRRLIWLLTGAAMVLIGPSAMVVPYGPRNFLPSYLLQTVVVLVFVAELVDRHGTPLLRRAITSVAAFAFVGVMVIYAAVYWQIHEADRARTHELERAVAAGASRVVIAQLPFRDFVHDGDPRTRVRARALLRFLDLPEDLHVIVRDDGRPR